jgi:hypothetical protein
MASTSSRQRLTARALAAGLLLFTLFSAAFAQDSRARLSGRVTDAAGAAVAGADVELRDLRTGETQRAQTNDEGIYNFFFLTPGGYGLRVSAPGFRTFVRDNVVLAAQQVGGVDVRLEVGQAADAVNVVGDAELLRTEDGTRAIAVNNKLLADMPLNQRNPLMAAQFLPGVSFRGPGFWQQPYANPEISAWSVNGSLVGHNEHQLDGAPNNVQPGRGTSQRVGYVPSAEAVQEVNVVTNAYDAQYGRTNGGAFNITTKSGGSDFHAAGWANFRRSGWNANSFFNNARGIPRSTPQSLDQWGFQADGQLWAPKLLKRDGRVKVFYLFNYENYHENLPLRTIGSVPEPEMLRGDFSKLREANVNGQPGRQIIIYDPLTLRPDPANPNRLIRDPFPGNIIPEHRINPVAKAVAALFPKPNTPFTGEFRYGRNNLILPNNLFVYDYYSWLTKVDVAIGDRHRLFVRPAVSNFDESSTYNGQPAGLGRYGGAPFGRRNYALLADYVWTVNPTTVFNVRGNAARYREFFSTEHSRDFNLTEFGIPQSVVNQITKPTFIGWWQIGDYPFSSVAVSSLMVGGESRGDFTNTYSLQSSLTKTWGAHNLKAGVDVRLQQVAFDVSGKPLRYDFGRNWTRAGWNDATTESFSGDGFATFLLGYPSSGSSENLVRPFYSAWYSAPYIQDDWKVSRRLTLNLGLRYDVFTGPKERFNRLITGFDRTTPSPLVNQISADNLARYPQLRNLTGGLVYATQPGAPSRPVKTDWNNLQPRVGAAFKITEKLVARGGFGTYYIPFYNEDFYRNLGFSSVTGLLTSLDGGQRPRTDLLTNPYPDGLVPPTGDSRGLLTAVGQDPGYFNQDMKMPFVHHFSFGFQYQLARQTVVDLSYVGSRTRGVQTNLSRNLPSAEFVAPCNPLLGGVPSRCTAPTGPNPWRGIEAFRGTGFFNAATLNAFDLNKPLPHFTGYMREFGRNDGKVWYDSMQLTVTERLTGGLTFLASYVFSKQIEQWGWMDEYRRIPQKSVYLADRPHQFKVVATYDLPFGRGRQFINDGPRWLNEVVGGWQVAPVFNMYSGEPADLPANAIMNRNTAVKEIDWSRQQVRGWDGGCVSRQDANGNYSIVRGTAAACGADLSKWDWVMFDNLFGTIRALPFRGDFVRGQTFFRLDASASKSVALTEKLRIQLRAEVINVTNSFRVPSNAAVGWDTNPASNNFGTIFPSFAQPTWALPRTIQLGAKVMW